MNETMVTVVGNVATAPVFRELQSGPVARFRLAATARHRDRTTGAWTDGHTNFFTVWAWRGLGTNVAASLSVGEPVIVQGRLKVRNEERSGGQQWMSADIDAFVVGHDLSRGTAAFRRVTRTDGAPGASQPASAAPVAAPTGGLPSAASGKRPDQQEGPQEGPRPQESPVWRENPHPENSAPWETSDAPAQMAQATGSPSADVPAAEAPTESTESTETTGDWPDRASAPDADPFLTTTAAAATTIQHAPESALVT